MKSSEQIPSAVVTGASSGIGHAFAHLLANDGFNLILVSRNESRLQDVKAEIEAKYATTARIIARDLSISESPSEIFEILKREGVTARVLINNAGFNVHGEFEKSDLEEELKMIRLHICAVTEMTKLFLRQRPKDGKSMILNVSSIAALAPGPQVSVHFATRAYILSFSLALSDELRDTDVHVTCLCPGPTRSDFFRRASMENVRLARGYPVRLMNADTVAAAGYAALKKRKAMIVPGLGNKILAFMAMMAPRGLVIAVSRWLMDRA